MNEQQRKAMELAIEALETYKGFIDDAHIIEGQWHWIDGLDNVQTAIKEALVQPEQEPSELLLRGILASELKCWHRLTADEAQNLVHFVQKMGSKQAQPEQEPVAFLTNHRQRINVQIKPEAFVWMPTTTDWEIPLYTTPPQRTWVGLTDDEFEDIEMSFTATNKIGAMMAVEAKLKEKNT